MGSRSLLRCAAFVAGAFWLASVPAVAQSWPDRPLTMVVPVAAGGGADPIARLVADHLGKELGQSVVVDFRPGGAMTIGANVVAGSAPDGYTLLFSAAAPLVNAKLLIPDLPYDPAVDITPITLVADAPTVLIASAAFEPKTFQEFIEYARANPGKVNAANGALGGTGHLATATIEHETGVQFTTVPYNGTGALMPDLLSGRVDITAAGASGFLGGIKDGRLRGLAVMADSRIADLPDVPTTAESGYPELTISFWYMLSGPKGMPEEVVNKIGSAVNGYLASDEGKAKIQSFGLRARGTTPEDARGTMERDTAALQVLIGSGAFKTQ